MIKLTANYNKDITPNQVSLSSRILTVDNTPYDLDNLDTDTTKPVYKVIIPISDDSEEPKQTGETEETHINIYVPKNRKFMFHSGNLYRFFDIDGNGIIDETELKTAIDYINETDNVKLQADLKKIYDNYMSVDGNAYETWIKKGK